MQPCGVWKINPDQIYVVIFRKLRYNVYKVDIIPAHEAVSEAPQKPGAQFRRRLMISAEIMV